MVLDSSWENEEEFDEFLNELIRNKLFDKKEEGITKLVLDKGINSLSDKQRYVFEKNVVDEFVTSECSRCGGDIPWGEMYGAHHNGGLCGWCEHMIDKDD